MASTQLSLLGQFPVERHSTVIERLSAQCESAEAYTLAEMVYRRDGMTVLQDDHALRVCAFRSTSTQQAKHPARRTRWSVQVLQKPEPARLSPEVLQRPLIECSIEDGTHPIALASAMGFSQSSMRKKILPTTLFKALRLYWITYSTRAFTLHTRGILFSRASNSVHIKVYQSFASTCSSVPLDPSHYIIQLYTQFGTTCAVGTGASAGRAGAGVGGVAGTGSGASGSGSSSGGLTMQEQKLVATASLKKVQALLKGLVDVGRVE